MKKCRQILCAEDAFGLEADYCYRHTPYNLKRLVRALVTKWRGEGEYWTGTPEDRVRQECADDLLVYLEAAGLTPCPDPDEIKEVLKQYGIESHNWHVGDNFDRELEKKNTEYVMGLESENALLAQQVRALRLELEAARSYRADDLYRSKRKLELARSFNPNSIGKHECCGCVKKLEDYLKD